MNSFNSDISALTETNYPINGDDLTSVGFGTNLVATELLTTERRSLSSPLALEPFTASSLYLNQQVLPLVKQALQQFALADDFDSQIQIVFGEGSNIGVTRDLVENLAGGEFPAHIQILPSSSMNGANGAFSEVNRTIYLSSDYLSQALGDRDSLTGVTGTLLEEIGHFVDSLN